MPESARTIFFAAFEPSGDILAARLMQELARRDPGVRFVGFGGPEMRAAGAELLEETTRHATVALGALGEVQNHRRRLKRLAGWLADHPIAALVPVDSPAANWSVCKQVRAAQPAAKIVHLACPQVWGWAAWRVRRLRKLSDRVLCLLPFEPEWLAKHGVPGVFVGHPVFEQGGASPGTDLDGLPEGGGSGGGGVRLAMMPGSRRGELMKNWPTMQRVLDHLHGEVDGLQAVVTLRDPADAEVLRGAAPTPVGTSGGYTVVAGRTESVLRWADVVLVKSGTSTLQVTARGVPMVAYYNVNRVAWHGLGRWLIHARTFALPNILGEWQGVGRVVPEFVPHFGAPEPLAEALLPLLTDAEARAAQRAALAGVAALFAGVRFAPAAADGLMELLG